MNTLLTRLQACNDKAKAFYTNIINFFKKEFADAQQFLDTHVAVALTFVEGLKAVVDNPGIQTLLEGLAGKGLADEVIATFSGYLAKAIDLLQLEETCAAITDPGQKIACFIDGLKKLSPEMQDALYHKVASILTRLSAAEGTAHSYTNSEIDTMVQVSYNKVQHDKLEAAQAAQAKADAEAKAAKEAASKVNAFATLNSVHSPDQISLLKKFEDYLNS